MHPTEELPSLRATLRLGGKNNDKESTTLYDVKFYPYNEPGDNPVFALVGGSSVWICRPVYDKDTSIEILRCFGDKDFQDSAGDAFNSVTWSQDLATGDPLVIVASETAKIKVLNVRTGEIVRTIIGHGTAINDLTISPKSPQILASGSNDHTVRIWNLDPKLEKFACAAICAGDGHTEGVLACAWHSSGRFLLSGGHDSKVNMWAIPNIPDHKNSGTDHVTMIHYPHFSSNEVHSDYVDCLQFFGDLIISKSAKERRIIFWRINGFPPTLYPTHNSLPAAPAPERGRASFTRSAFGSGFDRLLTFDLPFADLFYMRFALFHMPEKHPILCAGNEKSKVFFWDFHRLEEGPPAVTESGRWAGHRKKGLLQHNDSEAADDGTNTDLDAADSIEVDESGFKKPSRRKRDEAKPNRPTWIRGESHASNADTVSTDATPSTSFTGATEQGLGRGKGKAKTDPDAKYSADDPFRPLQAHKFQVIPKVAFAVRQCAWSPGGEWCVACGDNGMVALFSRWVGEK